MDQNIPIKRNPLMSGSEGLSFDNIESEELILLTDSQKSEKFLSKYLEVVHPFTRFKEYFNSSAKTNSHLLKEIKTFYIKLVLSEKWSEKKYVACINDIFENKLVLGVTTLDLAGIKFDKGQLASQKRIEGRSGRI